MFMFIVAWCFFELEFFKCRVNFLVKVQILCKTIKFDLLFSAFAIVPVFLAFTFLIFLIFASLEIK